MDLYDILACPHCKVSLQRQPESLLCTRCSRISPIVAGVPVLLPDGSIPVTQHQHELHVRQAYDPWIHRVVLQSLLPSSRVLDLGAGNMSLNLPNVVRMDVTLTPFVDVVGDAHFMPFLPGVFDFVFSLAVIEHLRQPFVAAQEMHDLLRPGGYVYGECNFVFAYHGYPHHYFNASQQGLEMVFEPFRILRSGVAPYQMPSFALRMVLETYRRDLGNDGDPNVAELQGLMQEMLNHPLGVYDARFSEERALQTAAGTFVFGVKTAVDGNSNDSQVIPDSALDAWENTPALQSRFPDPLNLGVADNLLLWAKTEGRKQFSTIGASFDGAYPFHKHQTVDAAALALFNSWQVIEPKFGNIGEVDRRQARRGSPGSSNIVSKVLRTLADEGVSGLNLKVREYIRWRKGR
jgi:uncharacterized protein YbaR (Trm112 family)